MRLQNREEARGELLCRELHARSLAELRSYDDLRLVESGRLKGMQVLTPRASKLDRDQASSAKYLSAQSNRKSMLTVLSCEDDSLATMTSQGGFSTTRSRSFFSGIWQEMSGGASITIPPTILGRGPTAAFRRNSADLTLEAA